MIPTKKASSDMNSAASPRKETTRLSALATGLRLTTTATPKISINNAKTQNSNGGIRRNFQFGIWNFESGSFLLFPFQHDAVHHAADFEKFFFVVHHLRARKTSDRVVFPQKNRLLGTDLFAHAAENAAGHVDIEFFRIFFDFGETVGRRNFAGNNFDHARRANKFAELTGHAAHAAISIAHKRWRTAIMIWQAVVPFLLGIFHGHLGASEQHVLKMFDRDGEPCHDRGQIQPLAPVEFRSWNSDGHDQKSESKRRGRVWVSDLQTGFTGLQSIARREKGKLITDSRCPPWLSKWLCRSLRPISTSKIT